MLDRRTCGRLGAAMCAVLVFGVAPGRAQLLDPNEDGLRPPMQRVETSGATVLRLFHQPVSPGDPVVAARAVLASVSGAAHLEGMDLRPRRVLRAHGVTVVRFDRYAFDLPVLSAAVNVRFDSQMRAESVILAAGSEAVEPPPVEPIEAPRASAVRALGWVAARPVGTRLVAFDDGEIVRATWEIEVQGALHERAFVYFDARSGDEIARKSILRHDHGRVWDPNPVASDDMPIDVELQNLTSNRFLTGRYVRAQSCDPGGAGSCVPTQRAVADAEGHWLYDPDEPSYEDEFVETNLYHHSDVVAGYFRDTHAFEWTCCDSSSIIEAIGNYVERGGRPYDNAFYSPSACSRDQCAIMAFGQGNRIDFGYDGDVVYHEFTHGIVDVTANLDMFIIDRELGISYEPGALNEGYSDYFSSTITGDPQLADYVSSGGGGGEASLRDLSSGLVCPGDLFGEVHADGTIWGGALWTVRERIGAEKADAVAFAALLTLSPTATLDEAATLVVSTAEMLDALDDSDRAAVTAVMEERGLLGCRRIVPIEEGRAHGGYSGVEFATGSLGAGVVPLHYSIEIPVDATSLTIRIRNLTPAGVYDLYLKTGSPVAYIGPRTPGLIGDTSFEAARVVALREGTDYPLPRCQTLYMALRATDLNTAGQSIYTIAAEIERSGDLSAECPVIMEDAGMDPDAGTVEDAGVAEDAGTEPPADEGGCGCRILGAGAPDPASSAAGLGLFALLMWRRVRRR